MGGTAIEDTLASTADKGENASGKAGTARQAVARKSPAEKIRQATNPFRGTGRLT